MDILTKMNLVNFGKEVLKKYPDINIMYVAVEPASGYNSEKYWLVLSEIKNEKRYESSYLREEIQSLFKSYLISSDLSFELTDGDLIFKEFKNFDILDYIKNNRYFSDDEINNEIKKNEETINTVKNKIEKLKDIKKNIKKDQIRDSLIRVIESHNFKTIKEICTHSAILCGYCHMYIEFLSEGEGEDIIDTTGTEDEPILIYNGVEYKHDESVDRLLKVLKS